MDPVGENLDGVLRKYGKIWIWSILSVAVAAFSGRSFMSGGVVMSMYAGQVNGTNALLMAVSLVHVVATVVAVWYLLLFLRYHIVPVLFPPSAPASEDEVVVVVPNGGILLCRVFGPWCWGLGRNWWWR